MNANEELILKAEVCRIQYGLRGVSLGVPCMVSQDGVERVLEVALPPDEPAALAHAAVVLEKALAQLELPASS